MPESTWAFEFEGQPYFDGFRDLATNGIDKPVMNVFRMLGQMRGTRLAVTSSGGLPLDSVKDRGVRGQAEARLHLRAVQPEDAHGCDGLRKVHRDAGAPSQRPERRGADVGGEDAQPGTNQPRAL